MNENSKVFFIINKYSGTDFQPELEDLIISQCGALHIDCTIEFTRDRGHATELAKKASSHGYEKVIAVGGDGTVNEVAQGLVHSNTVMGIIPKGSGNGLARHLRIPMNVKKSLEILSSQKTIRMDTLLINDKLAVNVAGIGFDGHVAGLFGKNGKRGLVGYIKLVTKEFFRYKEFPVEMIVDEKVLHRHSFILALANSSQFGNNATVSPYASICDTLMDVCLIKKVPLSQSIGFAKKLFSNKIHTSAFVEIIKAKKVSIRFPKPMPYHIDGESMEPESIFNISLEAASLTVIVPDNPKFTH
ncbi:MAG: YegS/Rv2252/BmrU family lipid kinase [Bacteroidia bacterium]|nr:YegS/Rv2252/BmrU family lipid kinase [Bacteroidia bacterium]